MELVQTEGASLVALERPTRQYVFILSAPRSGSTLLRVILNKFSEFISPPETYFLEFYRMHKHLDPASRSDRELLIERWLGFRSHLNDRNLYDKSNFKRIVSSDASSWRDVFNTLMGLYAHNAGKSWHENAIICEKTPLHIEYQAELAELFPDAKKIYLIRDPRDVVASLKTCPWGRSSIISNSFHWRRTADMIRPDSNSILIRYEDLVDNPGPEIARISALVDVPLDITLVNAKPPNTQNECVDLKNVSSFKPIDKTFSGKWINLLSKPDSELDVIETICYRRMLEYRYRPQTRHNWKLYMVILFQKWMELQYKRLYRRIL